jgi:hypothetical protein
MPLHQNSQSFPAVLMSGWRRIPTKAAEARAFSCLRSKGIFLLVLFTGSYATSSKQPIFSGCFDEWLATNTNKDGRSKGFFLLVLFTGSYFYFVTLWKSNCSTTPNPSLSRRGIKFPP